MKPVYAENLVVTIKYSGCFEWYVLEKDFCIMDGKKLDEELTKMGGLKTVGAKAKRKKERRKWIE